MMKILSLPKTRAGKWSVFLFIAFIVFAVAAGVISALQGNTIEYPNPINSPLLGSFIYLMFAAVIVAAVVGLIGVIKHKERSIFVFVPVAFGIFTSLAL